MPSCKILNAMGQEVGEMNLSDAIFGVTPNATLVHKMVVSYLANQRQGNQSAQTRGEVSGGGRKPWRQKGTGHARQGSIRSPQWTGGGVVFAPKPRDYCIKVNRKESKFALKSVLSSKALEKNLIILDAPAMETFKTREVAELLKALNIPKKAIFVLPGVDEKFMFSARNISVVKTAQVENLNVYDLVNHAKLVIFKDAVRKIEEVYA